MDDIKPQESQAQQPSPSLVSRALNVLAYPVGAVSGYLTFYTETRSTFYSNSAKRKRFADLQKPADEAIGKIFKQGEQGTITNVAEETYKVQEAYRRAADKRIEKWGFKGLGDRWKCLGRNQKFKICTEIAAVTGITFGAFILLSENIDRLKNVFKSNDDQSMTR